MLRQFKKRTYNMTNNNLKSQTYDILIRGAGGYFSLGSMSDEAASYWKSQETNDLIQHLQWPEEEDIGPKEGVYRLEDYRDSANIAQVVGFDDIEKIKVYSGDVELDVPDEGIDTRLSKFQPNNFESRVPNEGIDTSSSTSPE